MWYYIITAIIILFILYYVFAPSEDYASGARMRSGRWAAGGGRWRGGRRGWPYARPQPYWWPEWLMPGQYYMVPQLPSEIRSCSSSAPPCYVLDQSDPTRARVMV